MKVTTKSGRVLNAADLERIAAKAEAGFDISAWRHRPGGPYRELRLIDVEGRAGRAAHPCATDRGTTGANVPS